MKLRILKGSELPAAAIPKAAFNHAKIDLNSLENFGSGEAVVHAAPAEEPAALAGGPAFSPPPLMSEATVANLMAPSSPTNRQSIAIAAPADDGAPPLLSQMGGAPPLLSARATVTGPPPSSATKYVFICCWFHV